MKWETAGHNISAKSGYYLDRDDAGYTHDLKMARVYCDFTKGSSINDVTPIFQFFDPLPPLVTPVKP